MGEEWIGDDGGGGDRKWETERGDEGKEVEIKEGG